MRLFRMLMKLIHKNQNGIGLLELMLSLGIIAILLVMATRYFVVTSRNEKVNRAVSQINSVIAAVGNWKGSKPTYANLSVTELNKYGLLAAADVSVTGSGQNTTAVIISPFNTNATVTPGKENNSFIITYDGIPSWACEGLAAKFSIGGSCTADESTGKFVYDSTTAN